MVVPDVARSHDKAVRNLLGAGRFTLHQEVASVVKALVWIVVVIFLIGLLVVLGIFDLIF